jgi:uncharacterized protein
MIADYLIDIDPDTGELIWGWPRIKRSIIRILQTRLRTRIMRLWWGSNFLEMQDKPGNQETMMMGIGSAIYAINRYEPEFKVTRVTINEFGPSGRLVVTVDGVDLVQNAARRVVQSF